MFLNYIVFCIQNLVFVLNKIRIVCKNIRFKFLKRWNHRMILANWSKNLKAYRDKNVITEDFFVHWPWFRPSHCPFPSDPDSLPPHCLWWVIAEEEMLKFLKGVVGGSGTGPKDLPYNIGDPYPSAWGSWTHSRGTSKVYIHIYIYIHIICFYLISILIWDFRLVMNNWKFHLLIWIVREDYISTHIHFMYVIGN